MTIKRGVIFVTLSDFFNKNPKCALGFSGGIDSAYLLYTAYRLGVDVKPYFVKSVFQTDAECREAFELAKQFGFDLTVIEADVLSDDKIRVNESNRCYYCKKMLFSAIIDKASADGYDIILEGTNLSDDIDDRPGYKAIKVLGVISPLRECGITKSMIRSELKAAGVNIWNKPSSACLATRIPCGTEISIKDLGRVCDSESVMRELGFYDFRVRLMGDSAKIQLTAEQFNNAVSKRCEIYRRLSQYFKDVLLDLKER